MYENSVVQMIASSDREVFYHTWEKQGSTHSYEVDFLISNKSKIIPIEVKSSATGRHESIIKFAQKYSSDIAKPYLVSQRDLSLIDDFQNIPVYMFPFILQG